MLSEYEIGVLKSQHMNSIFMLINEISQKQDEIKELKQNIKEFQATIDTLNRVLGLGDSK